MFLTLPRLSLMSSGNASALHNASSRSSSIVRTPGFLCKIWGGRITQQEHMIAQKRDVTIAFQGSPFHCKRAVECTFAASPLLSAAADKRAGLKSRDQITHYLTLTAHALQVANCNTHMHAGTTSTAAPRYIPALLRSPPAVRGAALLLRCFLRYLNPLPPCGHA